MNRVIMMGRLRSIFIRVPRLFFREASVQEAIPTRMVRGYILLRLLQMTLNLQRARLQLPVERHLMPATQDLSQVRQQAMDL